MTFLIFSRFTVRIAFITNILLVLSKVCLLIESVFEEGFEYYHPQRYRPFETVISYFLFSIAVFFPIPIRYSTVQRNNKKNNVIIIIRLLAFDHEAKLLHACRKRQDRLRRTPLAKFGSTYNHCKEKNIQQELKPEAEILIELTKISPAFRVQIQVRAGGR